MQPEDLWPAFDSQVGERTPKTVIEEAGEFLRKKTQSVVIFSRMSVSITDKQVSARYSFYSAQLVYHFPFMEVSFGIDTSYPCKVVADKMPTTTLSSEVELIAHLRTVFNAPSTVATISRLISLAKG